jgi:hypothetical protein
MPGPGVSLCFNGTSYLRRGGAATMYAPRTRTRASVSGPVAASGRPGVASALLRNTAFSVYRANERQVASNLDGGGRASEAAQSFD